MIYMLTVFIIYICNYSILFHTRMIHIALSLDDSHRIDSESDILKALRF